RRPRRRTRSLCSRRPPPLPDVRAIPERGVGTAPHDGRPEEKRIFEQQRLEPRPGWRRILEALFDVALSRAVDERFHPADARGDALQLAWREALLAEVDALDAHAALLEPPLGLARLGALLLAEDLNDDAHRPKPTADGRDSRVDFASAMLV